MRLFGFFACINILTVCVADALHRDKYNYESKLGAMGFRVNEEDQLEELTRKLRLKVERKERVISQQYFQMAACFPCCIDEASASSGA